jgi:hypothetical protein
LSPDGNHNFIWDYVAGTYFNYWDGICSYCGEYYSDYLKENYQDSLATSEPSSYGTYLTLDHIDADGKYWYLVNGYSELLHTPGWGDFVDNTTSNSIGFEFTSWSTGTGSVEIYPTDCFNGLVAPIDGTYQMYYSRGSLLYETVSTLAGDNIYLKAWSVTSTSIVNLYSGSGIGGYYETAEWTYSAGDSLVNGIFGYDHPGFVPSIKQKHLVVSGFRNYVVCTPSVSAEVDNPQVGSLPMNVASLDGSGSPTYYNNIRFVDIDNNRFYDVQNDTWVTYET